MAAPKLFLDSSALFAGAASPTGAARQLLLAAERGKIDIIISEQVTAETRNALAAKLPRALPCFEALLNSRWLNQVSDPLPHEVDKHKHIISHPPDVPIVVAGMENNVDFLVTFNTTHFIDDSTVAESSGLRIGTPGDALQWLRHEGIVRS